MPRKSIHLKGVFSIRYYCTGVLAGQNKRPLKNVQFKELLHMNDVKNVQNGSKNRSGAFIFLFSVYKKYMDKLNKL